MKAAKKVKTAMSLDSEIIGGMQAIADSRHGGNLSKAINSALRNELDLMTGPMSKVFQFSSEVADMLRAFKLNIAHAEHAVDWILPDLKLGLEAKVRFTHGKAENATVAAMAFTFGQRLCSEIWIICAEWMTADDLRQWERVANEFHLCKVRVISSKALSAELKARVKTAGGAQS